MLLAVSLTVSAQDCTLQQKTVTKDIGSVTEIQNLSANVVPWGNGQKKCMVSLDGLAGGRWNRAYGEYIWDGNLPDESACGAAVSLAKKNLLNTVNSSTITNESVVICKEEKNKAPINVRTGTIVEDITKLRPHPVFRNMFYHSGQECRWFIESGWNGKDVFQMNGIACRLDPSRWIVVDKF